MRTPRPRNRSGVPGPRREKSCSLPFCHCPGSIPAPPCSASGESSPKHHANEPSRHASSGHRKFARMGVSPREQPADCRSVLAILGPGSLGPPRLNGQGQAAPWRRGYRSKSSQRHRRCGLGQMLQPCRTLRWAGSVAPGRAGAAYAAFACSTSQSSSNSKLSSGEMCRRPQAGQSSSAWHDQASDQTQSQRGHS